MPRGVYERKPKGQAVARSKKRRGGGDDNVIDLLNKLREQRTRAEDRVVAIGTAIEALEALDER